MEQDDSDQSPAFNMALHVAPTVAIHFAPTPVLWPASVAHIILKVQQQATVNVMADEQNNEEPNPYTVQPDLGFEVYRNARDQIAIKQEGIFGDDDQYVYVSPERVNKLIQFLAAVRDEILTDRADAASEANDIRELQPGYRPGMDP